MKEFSQMSLEAFPPEDNAPLFSQGDIVFITELDGKHPGIDWPAIGTKHEIDLKVTDYYRSKRGPGNTRLNAWFYNLISGKGYAVYDVYEDSLILAKNRAKLLSTCEIAVETEFCPKGTILIKDADYWKNEELGVYLHADLVNKLKTNNVIKNS